MEDKIVPGPAPEWARRALILTAMHDHLDRLGEMSDAYGASVVFLYLAPENEATNGWCPRGTNEQMGAFIREAHRHGLKVVTYFDAALVAEECLPGREDWVQRNPDGAPQHVFARHIGKERYPMCPNSPWLDSVMEMAKRRGELAADGIFLDNAGFHAEAFGSECCYCRHCRKTFLAAKGRDIDKANERELLGFKGESIGRLMRRTWETLAKLRDEPVVTANVCGDREPRTVKTLGPFENVVFREIWEIDVVDWKGLCSRLRQDCRTTAGKPEWAVLPLGIGEPFERTGPGSRIAIAAKIAGGARPFLWSQEVSLDSARTGLGSASLFSSPDVASAVSGYYHFLGQWGDILASCRPLPDDSCRAVDPDGELIISPFQGAESLVIHLVNLRGVGGAKTVAPVPRHDVELQLRLPENVRPKRIRILSPDFPEQRTSFRFADGGRSVLFRVPRLDIYDLAIIDSGLP